MTENPPSYGEPPTIHEIDRQIRRELETVQMGVERYHASIAGASLGDTDPGLRIMRNILTDRPDPNDPTVTLPGLVTAIESSREFIKQKISKGSGSGSWPAWNFMVHFLTPEKVAVIVTRTVLTPDANTRPDRAKSLPATALAVSRNIKLEIEYEEWIRTEAELQDADPAYLNIHKLLLARWRKYVDTRVFRRWKRKLQNIQELPWSRNDLMQYGAFLLNLLIRHGGGYFEKEVVRVRGHKTEARLVLTGGARQMIEDIHTNLEITRPYLLPMRCPPKPWRRT